MVILFKLPLDPVVMKPLKISGQEVQFLSPSQASASAMMSGMGFLKQLAEFAEVNKDELNEETIELLEPYLRQDFFTPAIAKKAYIHTYMQAGIHSSCT